MDTPQTVVKVIAAQATKRMTKVAVFLGMLAVILPAFVRSESLGVHLMNSIEIDLANDLPIRIPLRADLSRIRTNRDHVICYDCYSFPFEPEPFDVSIHEDFGIDILFSRFY